MAFNNLQPPSGPFFLNAGYSIRIWVQRDGGQDYGAQWIMAHPIPNGQPPAELRVTDHSKLLQYSIASYTVNGGVSEYGYDPNSLYWEYRVTVTNLGTSGTSFNVQGGGNT
jgi:hypothetical protein